MKKERKDKHFIKKPTYPGGLKAMREFISKELKYPEEALANKIEGTVRLKYDIDFKGNVVATYVLSSLGHGCDEEAKRLVKKLKFHVDRTRKMKVVFHKNIQINFKLPKEKVVKPKPKQPTKITKITYSYNTVKTPEKIQISKNNKRAVYNYTVKIKK